MAKTNENELYDLCLRCFDDWGDNDRVAMETGADRILEWFDLHKNDTEHLKAAALYTDDQGCTGLHWIAVDWVQFEVIDTWLKHVPETAQIKTDDGNLPLHDACTWGASLKVVMALVEAYPKSVGETTDEGWLPLHCACAGETSLSVEVLSFLLKTYPESINGEENKTRASETLQDWAERERMSYDEEEDSYDSEVEDELITTVMRQAIIGGHFLVVKLFVIAFPGIALIPNDDGMVPLHHACSNTSSIDMAMVLLDAAPEGATITDKWILPEWQVSPLHEKKSIENNLNHMF